MKTILEICREVADLAATKRPNNLFDTQSQQEAIFLSVAKSALDSLMRYGDWQELIKDGCLRTIENVSDYKISDFAPDFYSLINDTIYVKDIKERVIGAITPAEWQKEKFFCVESIGIKFKIQNGRFKFLTPPPAGVKIVFQYRANSLVWDFDTFAEKSDITANTDVPIFDEYLVKCAILWRWLKRSGLDYTEEYEEYARELKKRMGSETAVKNICLAKNNSEEGGIINVISSAK